MDNLAPLKIYYLNYGILSFFNTWPNWTVFLLGGLVLNKATKLVLLVSQLNKGAPNVNFIIQSFTTILLPVL